MKETNSTNLVYCNYSHRKKEQLNSEPNRPFKYQHETIMVSPSQLSTKANDMNLLRMIRMFEGKQVKVEKPCMLLTEIQSHINKDHTPYIIPQRDP